MDEPTRRAWSTPELIVLVRSGPEEAVLAVCKLWGALSDAPGKAWAACIPDTLGYCYQCDAQVYS